MPKNAVIAGAGVFGAGTALELARRGHRVILTDPGPLPHPDASSTDISKAVRMDYGTDDFYMDLMAEAFAGWDAWNERMPAPRYHQDGFLLLTRGPMRPGEFEYESFTRLAGRGVRPERMDAAALRKRFPAWNADLYPDGYLSPRAGWAESGEVVAWMIGEAREAGVEVREGVRMAGLIEDDGRVGGTRVDDGSSIRADVTIVAAGAWTPVLLPHLGELMWAVGQPVFHFLPADPEPFRPERFPVWAADIARSGWYGFPALPDGRVKVANHGPGRRVHPGDPRVVAPGDEERFRAFLRESLPSLAEAPLAGSRLCLYCDTWDGDFYIDGDPERPGLVVATGGSGHAFKFAPVLGRIVADVVEGVANPYAKRFAWRPRGEGGGESARHTGDAPRK